MTQKTKLSRSDLLFFPSERLTDDDEGGGQPLGTPIKGVANEIFNPISNIARVNGAFYAREIYAGVQRADAEPLIGSFVALTKPPKDPNVSYLLFKAGFGELRKSALKRIEAFNVATIESKMTLLSNPTKGSKIIQAYQRVGETLPQVGDVYCLRQDKKGYEQAEQYVQVVKAEGTERTFTVGNSDFKRTVVKIELSTPLLYDFVGVDYPINGQADPACKIRETHIANAANYYGIKPIVIAIKKSAQSIQVPSLMEQLIPTNQQETVLADQTISNSLILFNGSYSTITTDSSSLRAVVPNTLTMGSITDKDGQLLQGGVVIGTIDYQTGKLTTDARIPATATYAPAYGYYAPTDSVRIDVDIANRSYNYTITLPNITALTVSYVSNGVWYQLSDVAGRLVGASDKHGGGTINYATGTVTLTCGELPDIDTPIFFSFALTARLDKPTLGSAMIGYELAKAPQSVIIEGKRGTMAGSSLTGDLSGSYKDGVLMTGTTATTAQISYDNGGSKTATLTNNQLSALPIKAGLTTIAFEVVANGNNRTLVAYDDGNGKLLIKGVEIGTIDYNAATINVNASANLPVSLPSYRTETYTVKRRKWLIFTKHSTQTRQFYDGEKEQTVEVALNVKGATARFFDATSSSDSSEFAPCLVAYLSKKDGQRLAPDSIILKNGNRLITELTGVLYWNKKAVGKLNYETGQVLLTDFDGTALTLVAGVAVGDDGMDSVNFRTATAPLRANSLQIMATIDNKTVSATADRDGHIDSDHMNGYVDIKTGAVNVEFGKWATVDEMTSDESLNLAQYPYDAQKAKYWLNRQATDIRYNVVGLSYLPLDSEIIKIDTVRLPQDGRVAIFRRGDTILIANTQAQTLGSAFRAGQTVQLDRQNLDRICLVDSNDKAVLATLWEYDLANGTITFNSPLDLSGYALPLIAKHTIEERNRIVKADIDGTLSLMFPTRHDYPLDNTYVSSVLIGGDLQVSVSVPFTQRNWNKVWSNEPVGEQLLNKLNLKDYPMVLTDDGAISERWLIKWTSGSQFELYGESLGYVGKFDNLTDLAPTNPATNKPYFTLPKQAFGNKAPWEAQDVIRFNTTGTLLPLWVLCAVQPNSDTQVGEDGFRICLFGDTTEE